MSKGKAFIVVGQADWGKSETLKALTKGSRHKQKWDIGKVEVFIRRMSNDDQEKELEDFVGDLDQNKTPYLVATLCPTFNNEDKRPALLRILAVLKKKYNLFFFVLRHQGKNPDATIPPDEIVKLEGYGSVHVFKPKGEKAGVIARAFQVFVIQNT